eukprot:5100755-Amphidinium_carterae.1
MEHQRVYNGFCFSCQCGKLFSSQLALRAHCASKRHPIPVSFLDPRDVASGPIIDAGGGWA